MLLIRFLAAAQKLKILLTNSFTVSTFLDELAIVDRYIIVQDEIKLFKLSFMETQTILSMITK